MANSPGQVTSRKHQHQHRQAVYQCTNWMIAPTQLLQFRRNACCKARKRTSSSSTLRVLKTRLSTLTPWSTVLPVGPLHCCSTTHLEHAQRPCIMFPSPIFLIHCQHAISVKAHIPDRPVGNDKREVRVFLLRKRSIRESLRE